MANKWRVECVDKTTGHKFERLIEFVLCRIIHGHNRGFVDERCLDEEKNLDGLKVGDPAPITERYWELANELCCHCLRQVAIWAES